MSELHTALYYLHVPELKQVCSRLNIKVQGKKAALIEQIVTFLKTGRTLSSDSLPHSSKAQKGIDYPLHPDGRMMHGAYKNDLRTRQFLKTLIGPHFHFTVYGLDFLKARWKAGQPPTYREFAHFWQQEYLNRKGKQSPLKQEWAYLTFMRRYAETHPHASRTEALSAWEAERAKQVQKVMRALSKLSS